MLKVTIYNEVESTLRDPILGRPFSHNQDRWEWTDSHEKADWIMGHLDYLRTDLYYSYVSSTKLFTRYQDKFVLWAMHDTPTFAYEDTTTLKFISQPLKGSDENQKHRIVPVPLQMRHYEYEMIKADWFPDWLAKLRETKKEYDFMYVGQTGYQGREFLRNLDLPNYYLEETSPIWGIRETESRIELNKKFCEKLAKSKYVFCPRGEGSSSFRLFQSLMSGSVPIISGMEDRPFSDQDWESFAEFGENYSSLPLEGEYNLKREKGMKFWDDFCHIEKCDRVLFDRYLKC